jgi:circadian clock protein KaiC
MVRSSRGLLPTKTPTGVVGLDAVLHGGLPRGKTTLITGAPGCGKTTLAVQFIANGAVQCAEPGLIVTFEEDAATLKASAASFLATDTLDRLPIHVVDARPTISTIDAGSYDIDGLLAILGEQVRRLGIRRIALDGLDALFVTSPDRSVDIRQFRRLLDFVESSDLTAVVVLKGALDDAGVPAAVHMLEFASDAVIRLGTRITNGFLQRLLQVVKIRGTSFATGEHAFIIAERGIEVGFSGVEKAVLALDDTRSSTGISRLDRMLEGGLLPSTITLVSGLPGTAKSTLGASFANAGLKHGERALLVALDEPAEQLMRNMRSVGIDLLSHAEAGTLMTLSLNPAAAIADDIVLLIERAIEEFKPTRLVVDPISALHSAGSLVAAERAIERLAYLIKLRGMTAVFTGVADSQLGELEGSTSRVSTIADTWIHLSYAAHGGERNRTLTIIKSRGTSHSNQLRELRLGKDGITLSDVYMLEGDVLLGTARLQREQRDLRMREEERERTELALAQLEDQRLAAEARARDIEVELRGLSERIATIRKSSLASEKRMRRERDDLMTSRSADPQQTPPEA